MGIGMNFGSLSYISIIFCGNLVFCLILRGRHRGGYLSRGAVFDPLRKAFGDNYRRIPQ